MNATVLETIKRSAAVPSMPQVVLRFLEIMRDPMFDYTDLVKILSTDPGTVGEILRLANSALFGVRNKVVSTRQALTLLGPKRTRSLLLGRYLVDTMSKRRVKGLDMGYFWRRSVASSVIASHFAEKLIPRQRDETFVSALLADIGVPILADTFADKYNPILHHYKPNGGFFTAQEEVDLVEATHAEVGAMVLGHWTLPSGVVGAVNLHQSDAPGTSDAGQIGKILNASDRIATLLCETPDPARIEKVCEEALSFIRLQPSTLLSALPTIEADIEELASALRIDVISGSVYSVVVKTIQEKLAADAFISVPDSVR
ncbi:MAG: HDOD domain-containing protein [Planctomycetes bacterium]|nr:HDOD domain-containing protein [Planctomycetota bacterium]MBI3834412.1 HDOD domain-containing protein [Planctomycetota bacterium]